MLKKTFRLYRDHYVALLRLGVPIMIGQLGIIIVGFADNMMVGHHTSEELAAASFVNNLFNLPLMFALGFSLGLTPLIGNLVGKNQVAKAGQTLRYGLIANLLLAILLIGVMSVVYVNIDRMGQPEELLPLIKPYFLIHLSGLIFIMLFNAFKQFADGIMDTRISMYILLCGNVLNIIGNYLLIFGPGFFPELGLLGAGFSTLLSRIFTLSVFVYLFFFTSRYGRFKEGFRHLKGDSGKQLLHLTKMGMPIAFQMGMETGSFNLSVIMMGWIGTAALAAHQAVATFTTIGFMLYYGIGSAITILVSNAKGAGEMNKVRSIANAGFACNNTFGRMYCNHNGFVPTTGGLSVYRFGRSERNRSIVDNTDYGISVRRWLASCLCKCFKGNRRCETYGLNCVCQLFPRMFACGIFIWLCLSGWCYGYLVGISDWSDFGRSLVLFSFQV